MEKNVVYIIHPFRNDMENNSKNMKNIASIAVRAGHVPIATALYFPTFLNEKDEKERMEGIDCGLTLMECCDEAWLFGFEITEGMKLELDYAKELNLPVCLFDRNMNRVNLRTLRVDDRVTPEYREAIKHLKLIR